MIETFLVSAICFAKNPILLSEPIYAGQYSTQKQRDGDFVPLREVVGDNFRSGLLDRSEAYSDGCRDPVGPFRLFWRRDDHLLAMRARLVVRTLAT